jgi:DNA repair protein RadC
VPYGVSIETGAEAMKQHLQEIAQKFVNAENAFAALVVEKIGCTEAEGFKVFALYKKNKLLSRIDLTNQRYTVKHGAFLAPDVMRRALEQAK